jgi:hypothetical protein
MKKTIPFSAFTIILLAVDLVAKPDQLIAKDQMIDIMYDLAV